MKVGVALYFQGYQDWDRFEAVERGEGQAIDPQLDRDRWTGELESAIEAEELGFDSLWAVEHHVSPYTMIPNPIGLLQYLAGATKRVDLGTMVVVLPWHHPLRVAEDMTMLQYAMRGRRPMIGVGRGLGRREFRQLGVDMNESAGRFAEAIQVIQLAIREERFSFHGQYYDLDDISMRPRPLNPEQLIDDMHFSWGSPTSAPIGAAFGLKPLIIPQRAWSEYHAELEAFAKGRHEAGYPDAVRPRLHMNVFCAETHDKAEDAATRHLREYCDSAMRNYEIAGNHFKEYKGYEHYAQMAEMRAHLPEGLSQLDAMAMLYKQNHIWGTPDECIEKMRGLCDAFHPDEFMLVFRYGSMSKDVADASTRLFAKEVLPTIHEIPFEAPIDYVAANA
jgi:alkanesulfonate monooxygenase SsuD/methylene tetrahydromethanopterin reductase-like flavin-dependent oxidoreductase (luciferase family)